MGLSKLGNGDKFLNAFGISIGEKNNLSVHVSSRPAGSLNERRLASQKPFLIGIQNTDHADFRQVKAFAQKVDPNQNIKFAGAQRSQDFDSLNRVNFAVEIAHFQSDIAKDSQ